MPEETPDETIPSFSYVSFQAYMLALEATEKLEFPALHKDILTQHSVMKYRKFAGFCAKVLKIFYDMLPKHSAFQR